MDLGIKTPKVEASPVADVSDAYVEAAWKLLEESKGEAGPAADHIAHGDKFSSVEAALVQLDEEHSEPFVVRGAAGAVLDDATMALLGPQPTAPVSPTRRPVAPEFLSWAVDHDRFELRRRLGHGSYGAVAEAIDHKTGKRVAIKQIKDVFGVFENALRIYREIKLLAQLNHPNIVRLVHVEPPIDRDRFTDVYIVFEAMDMDLLKLSRDVTQSLTTDHVRWFMYAIVKGLAYLHSAGIIHRDIKPANILASEACDMSICDFGLARMARGPTEPAASDAKESSASSGAARRTLAFKRKQLTKHVVTRWYRAPELPLYNDGRYGAAIDMWSLGCILAEMLGMMAVGPRRSAALPLFPGVSCLPLSRGQSFYTGPAARHRSGRDQLSVIVSVVGTPSREEIETNARTKPAKEFLEDIARHPQPRVNFKERYPEASFEALELLDMMLQLFPEKRATAAEVLAHPFFDLIRVPESEVMAESPVVMPEVTPANVRALMLVEMDRFNPGKPTLKPLTPPPSPPSAVAATGPAPGDFGAQGRQVSWAPDVTTPAGSKGAGGEGAAPAAAPAPAPAPAPAQRKQKAPRQPTHTPLPTRRVEKEKKCCLS